MGQQQLLLLVIGVVIVGFAVMAGFYAAEKTFKQSVADNLVERNLSIATDAVFWKTKTDPYSGGNARYSGLADNGMQKLFLGEETENGTFKITVATDTTLQITAVSKRYPDIGARTFVSGYSIDSTLVDYNGNISLME